MGTGRVQYREGDSNLPVSKVTTEQLTRGGKDIAFADSSSLWRSHRRLVNQAFTLFGEGSHKLQDIGDQTHTH